MAGKGLTARDGKQWDLLTEAEEADPAPFENENYKIWKKNTPFL
jgi:hypothetical protein